MQFDVRALVLLSLIVAAGLAVATAAYPSEPSDCIVLDDFSRAKVGEFPTGWEARKEEGQGVYRVREEGGHRYLGALSKGLGIQAGRQLPDWNLATHPMLVWSWRLREFPHGADERTSSTNDSALAVYVAVPYSRIRGPKAVKYIWSERVPVGERLSSNAGLTQVRVQRSGREGAEAWHEERVNARDDYQQFFKESAAPRAAGIAVLTDADDTKSTASGDYANFRACRS